jgi:hypothetical protein
MKYSKLEFADIPTVTLPANLRKYIISYYYQTGYVESVLNVYHEGFLLKSFTVTLREKQEPLTHLHMVANEFYLSLQKAFSNFVKEETKPVSLFKDLLISSCFRINSEPNLLYFKFRTSKAYCVQHKEFTHILDKTEVTQVKYTFGNETSFNDISLNQFFCVNTPSPKFYCKIYATEAYNLNAGYLVTNVNPSHPCIPLHLI